MKKLTRTRGNLLGLGVIVTTLALCAGGVVAQPNPTPAPKTPAPATPSTPAQPEKKPEEKPKTDVPAADLPKAEEILDKYVEVTGGKAAYDKIKTTVMVGTLSMMGMQGDVQMYAANPGKIYSLISLKGIGDMRSGSDGETVWVDVPGMGPRIVEGAEREQVLNGAKLDQEANWRKQYTKFQTVGIEDVKGKPAYKVELTTKDDQKRTAFYDRDSGLLVKQTMQVQTPQMNMQTTISFSDYKKVGDILYPHKMVTESAMQSMTMVLEKIEANVDVPAEKFELPAEVKELKEKKAKKGPPKEPKPVDPTPEKK